MVTERELGKVYTMLGCLEAAIPLAASPLLTEIYNNTLETFPGQISLITILTPANTFLLRRRVSGAGRIRVGEPRLVPGGGSPGQTAPGGSGIFSP